MSSFSGELMRTAGRPSVLGQTLMTFCTNSSGYVCSILTGIVVARVLGPAEKGIASYAALFLGIFTTFGLGLQSAVLYDCGRGKSQEVAFGTVLRLLGVTTLPVAALLIIIGIRYPQHAAFIYVACALPFVVYCQTANAVFLLNNDVRTTNIQGLIPTLGVGLLTVPALTMFHGGLNAVLTIWSGMFVASACFTLIRLNKFLPPFSLRADVGEVRAIAIFALKAGFASLAGFLNLRIDVFVVSLLLDARTLGIYTLAVAAGEMMWQVSRPLIWTMVGRIAKAERGHASELTNKITRNVLAVECALGVALFVLAPYAVRFVYGSAYVESASVMRWLMPGLVIYATSGPLSYFLTIKMGKPSKSLAVQVSSVVLCAGISFVAIPRLNVFGAALATTVTYCCATAALAVMYMRYSGSSLASFTILQPEDLARLGRLAARLKMWSVPKVAVVD
jgi:O-antigen/teichoic acid export membrane protein